MKKLKTKVEMPCTIDVRGLTDEDIKLLKEFADFLKQKARREKVRKAKENIEFSIWPLGVKGDLTRQEIYDHL